MKHRIHLKISDRESLIAEIEMDSNHNCSLDIESLKHIIHSDFIGYDIDCTYELFINADKRNYAVQLLMSKCRIDHFNKGVEGVSNLDFMRSDHDNVFSGVRQ